MADGSFERRAGPSLKNHLSRVFKLGTGVADQYVYSATNLLPSIAVARSTDVDGFALFSSLFLVYMLCFGASKAVIAESAAIRSFGDESFEVLFHSARALVWRAILTAGPLFVILSVGAVGAGGPYRIDNSPYLWFGLIALGFPFHALQDVARTMLVAARKPVLPLVSDLVWLGTAAFGLFPFYFHPITWACLVWVLGGIFACMIVCPPRLVRGEGVMFLWSSSYARPSLSEYLMQPAVVQGTVLLCGVAGSPDSLAALRGGTMLFRPIGLLLNSHRVLAFGASKSRRHGHGLVLWTGMLASFLGIALFAAVMWFLPDTVGRALLGPTWALVHDALVPLALAQAFALASYVFVTDLKSQRIMAGLGSIRLVGVVAIPLMTVAGALWNGPTAAAWGLCLGQALGLAWVARRAIAIRRQHAITSD